MQDMQQYDANKSAGVRTPPAPGKALPGSALFPQSSRGVKHSQGMKGYARQVMRISARN